MEKVKVALEISTKWIMNSRDTPFSLWESELAILSFEFSDSIFKSYFKVLEAF